MSMTALIVELLIVGVGTVTWVALILLCFLHFNIPTNSLFVIPYTAITYVLGVVTDRFFRNWSGAILEKRSNDRVWSSLLEKTEFKDDFRSFEKAGGELMKIEKIIRQKSEPLGRKIDYNRSRLRICRAWSMNLPLITASYILWGYTTGRFLHFPLTETLFLVILTMVLCKATVTLSNDHIRDLVESYEVIQMSSSKNRSEELCRCYR